MIFALVGNQNCGKTTLFNALTGSNQHVGNFPGVTVEQKSGEVKGVKNCSVVDLPGIYSMRPYTQEEIVSRDFIINQKPDCIINIIDATNIERNLYLTLQLLELRVPTVIALNMMDEVYANGGTVDVQQLSRLIGVPVVPISAVKGEGVSELIDRVVDTARKKALPGVTDFCADDSPVHRCIHAVIHLIQDHADRLGVSSRFCTAKLIEGDPELAGRLELDENERELLEHCIVQMETETGLDRNAALADMRYSFIESVVSASVVKCRESREHARSVKMDRLLTGRYTAVPVFLGIMLLTFWLTFDVIGQRLSDWLAVGVDALTALVDRGLTAYGINPVVKSLIVDGICSGVGSVLVFLPIIVTLFFFLSILEDTGYMARVAFVMDKPLRRIGLSGRSIVPLLIGFGCSVPAIMATRTVSSDRDRKMTILLTPYMSCSAKISIYAFFTAAFFPQYGALVMIALYLLGILIGIVAGYLAAFIMGFVLPTTGVTAEGVEFTKAWVLNWSKVAQADWFAIPKLVPVKIVFDMRAILPVLIMFIVTAVRGIGRWHKNNNSPRLTVDATIVSKRMDVTHHHNSTTHTNSSSTWYYATFQVASGDRMELSIPTQDYGYLVEGDHGKLTFQGTRYLSFERA